MANTSVPEPKLNGLYSDTLLDPFERLFITRVQTACTEQGLGAVTVRNAHQLLHIIGQEAVNYAGLPKWPHSLSTIEGCNDYMETHGGFWQLLGDVHQKQAYAWLCENGMSVWPVEEEVG